nr:PREDICTED: facilitated trehalose transporter Tret1-like [Bemisia tabaci]XP_018916225.1 PREDICTED: facilitated trehalose transporter Tret1-like [Bemisia tabaci]
MASSDWKGKRRQTTAAFFCGLGSMTVGLMVGWPAAAFPKILRHETPYHLSIFNEAFIISCMNIGSIVGTVPASLLMDRIGRRASFLLFSLFAVASWIFVAYAPTVEMLYCGRLLGGVFVGAYLTILPSYLSETLEPDMRGFLGTSSTLLNTLGTLMAYGLGPRVSFNDLSLISCCVAIVFIISLIFMPETPYLLVMRKDYAGARRTLAWLRGTSESDVTVELTTIQNFIETEKAKASLTTSDLFFDERYKWPFVSCVGLLLLQKSSGYFTVIGNQTIILPHHAWIFYSEDSTLIIGLILVIMSIVAALLMDALGRKVLLQISNVGQASAMLVVGAWYYLSAEQRTELEAYNYMPLLAVFAYVVAFSMGLGPVPHIYIGEVLPPLVKGRATGLLVTLAALFVVSVNEIFAAVTTFADMYVNFLFFGVCSLVGIYYVNGWVIETRGKTLPEIQEEFRHRRTMKDGYYILD